LSQRKPSRKIKKPCSTSLVTQREKMILKLMTDDDIGDAGGE
jgi:hypothetical protein